MSNQKKDFLAKYLPKKTSVNQNKPLPQLKIIDPELAFENNSSQDEEEVPSMYNPQGLILSETQAKTLLKKGVLEADFMNKSEKKQESSQINKQTSGKWVNIAMPEEESNKNYVTKKENSDSDESPERKRHDSDSEQEGLNADEKEKKAQDNLKRTYAQALGFSEDSDLSPERNEENENKINIEEENKRRLTEMAEQFKNVETVFRDDKGIKIDLSKKFEDKKAELLRKNQERIMEWGSGFIQKKEKKEKKKEEDKLKTEKFTNYEISKETEKELMGVDRFGDPMKILIENDKKKEKGSDPKYIGLKKKCKFRGIPNRFGIEPGHRWDGVDRGNGYEKKYLGSINKRRLEKDQKEMEHLKDM